MEHIALLYKFGTAFLGGYISYLFGSMTLLLDALVLFVIVDYISGMLASAYDQEFKKLLGKL
ncbi:phage holin family protein [Metabacillus herbersteinensis]|uniref:Phage holin family protein n=1 Tax=Metabacillus herbersteinensis TaxID=283816 RepID=A0ABV6GG02_9BACI